MRSIENIPNIKNYENKGKVFLMGYTNPAAGINEAKNTVYSDNNHEKKKEEKLKKEKLREVKEMEKYIQTNSPKLAESLELVDFRDSGGESNVFNIFIKNKRKDGKLVKKKAIMKAILSHRREKEIQRQIIISNKLKNKNIIDYFGSKKLKDETVLMLMEEAKYGHLRNFERNTLKRMTFSESMLCFLGSQILKGIAHCHRCKVAHLDIKLQNVVVDEYLNAKLIDFSISINYRKRKNEKITLPCRGTNFYMPLEVLKSKEIKIQDISKVDLYGFGVLLYNLAFNRYPHNLTHGDEDNYEEIIRKIENNEITFEENNYYSSYFLDFLKQLLEVDINKRISLSEALNHYWITGAELLFEEKEKCCNAAIFTSYLLTNHIKSFNDYIQKKC